MKKFVLGILSFIGLGFGTIFAQNILPDSAEISVLDEIIVGEATNLKVTIMKNDSKMSSYQGTIVMFVTDESGIPLKENEFTLPSNGYYQFQGSDLGTKEFQRGLEIKKEGRFYVEVQDLNDNEDKVLGRKLVIVKKKIPPEDIKTIYVDYPVSSSSLIGDKVEVIAKCTEIPNSQATIYMDNNECGTVNVATDGSINYTIPNVTEGQHTLYIEIPGLEGEVLGKSDNVFFTISPYGNGGIKEVIVDPPTGLMITDMVNITVMTDDMIESLKLRMSDRPDNDSIVMNKSGIGEFSQNVFLLGTGEVNLSFDTTASNNVNQSYENLKTITVADYPKITELKADVNVEEKFADVTWEIVNGAMVSSYYVDWWVEGKNLSGNAQTTTRAYRFSDVPYDTIVNVNITPYRSNNTKHGAASNTVQFVLQKNSQCGNGVCDEGESPETCPIDCGAICGNGICELGETAESCPEDCQGGKPVSLCVAQTVPVRTTKIGDSYYLIRDKADNVTKYLIYSSTTQDIKNRTKIYETTDTSYEYPFDYDAKEDTYMYFWVVGICESGEEVELTGATKVKVGPAQNFFLLLCLTVLIYAGIKLFRQTE